MKKSDLPSSWYIDLTGLSDKEKELVCKMLISIYGKCPAYNSSTFLTNTDSDGVVCDYVMWNNCCVYENAKGVQLIPNFEQTLTGFTFDEVYSKIVSLKKQIAALAKEIEELSK